MEKKRRWVSDIFVRGRKLTLGVKVVGTFAITYYSFYFILLTIFGFYYRSVYEPAYSGDTLFQNMLVSFILWLIVLLLVVSLLLLFSRRTYGKFLFMIFSVILILYQYFTTDNHVWVIYGLELLLVLIMAPLKVISKIKDEVIVKMHKM